jgi:hypothetical protein
MRAGLLWFDDRPGRELAGKAEDAARRYREKFGVPADVCYVHPAALAQMPAPLTLQIEAGATLRIAPLAYVLPHHFWVGVEDG